MERDMSVTVTRDNRVSHVTTTPPHPTYLLLRRSVVSGYDQIQVTARSGDWTWQ